MKQDEAHALAKRAAAYLYEDDPYYVIGGCSDISEVIAELLRHRGYVAKVIYGIVKRGKKGVPFEHAWLNLEGRRFDPVLWVVEAQPERYIYRSKPEVMDALACEVQWQRDNIVPELEKALFAE